MGLLTLHAVSRSVLGAEQLGAVTVPRKGHFPSFCKQRSFARRTKICSLFGSPAGTLQGGIGSCSLCLYLKSHAQLLASCVETCALHAVQAASPGMISFPKYVCASTAVASGMVYHAFATRHQ